MLKKVKNYLCICPVVWTCSKFYLFLPWPMPPFYQVSWKSASMTLPKPDSVFWKTSCRLFQISLQASTGPWGWTLDLPDIGHACQLLNCMVQPLSLSCSVRILQWQHNKSWQISVSYSICLQEYLKFFNWKPHNGDLALAAFCFLREQNVTVIGML